MNLLGSFDMFMAICDDTGTIISLFIYYLFMSAVDKMTKNIIYKMVVMFGLSGAPR